MISTGYLLEYSKIFDDEVKDFSVYLDGIGIDKIVTFCSHFLSVDLSQPEFKTPENLIELWFSNNNLEIKQKIRTEIDGLDPKLKKNLTVINIYNILLLFEFAFNNLPKASKLEDAVLEVNLFKCILALNEDFNQRDKKIGKSTEHLDSKTKFPALMLTTVFTYYDLVEYSINERIITQFIKSSLLFKFLEDFDDTTNGLLSKLLESYNSKTWKEFLKKYLPLVHGLINPERKGYLDITIKRDENFGTNIEFLDILSINNEVTIEELDFIKVRSKPFYKIEEDKYRIISPLFTCEKIYEGLYFLLNTINKKAKTEGKTYIKGDFRGFYCSKFSEEYLLYKILDSSFPKKFIKYTGQQLRDINISGEPDYYVRNKNKIFLFESKDVLINAKHKQSNDFSVIEKSLKDKFHYYEKDGVKHFLGISQVLNNVKRILNGEYDFDSINKENVRIYPILITHHSLFNSAGLNHIINKWFETELKELESQNINIDNVNSLVIIDINTFILYHELLRSRTIIFEHLIDNYIAKTSFKNSNLSNKGVNERVYESVESFSYFVSVVIDNLKKWKVPQLFTDLGMNLFIS